MIIKKQLLLLTVLLLILVGSVSAEQIIPVSYDVSVDFDGERDFRLLMPNGYERHFTWTSGQTHADTTFTHTIYQPFNESQYCTNVENYQDINKGLLSMLNVCENAVASTNETNLLSQKLLVCNNNLNTYESNATAEKTKRENCENNLLITTNNAKEYKDDLASCELEKSRLPTQQELTTCKTDLEDQKKKNQRNIFISFGAGVGAGFLLWGRKQKQGPSEQIEAGFNSFEPADPKEFNYQRKKQPSSAMPQEDFAKFD